MATNIMGPGPGDNKKMDPSSDSQVICEKFFIEKLRVTLFFIFQNSSIIRDWSSRAGSREIGGKSGLSIVVVNSFKKYISGELWGDRPGLNSALGSRDHFELCEEDRPLHCLSRGSLYWRFWGRACRIYPGWWLAVNPFVWPATCFQTKRTESWL